MSSAKCLYRYEAKGLQAFILQTNQLREIKGGSLLIENLSALLKVVCETLPEAERPQILASAAGGATLRFAGTEGATGFASIWPMMVERFVPGLQVVQGWVLEGETGAWDALQEQLRSQRNAVMVGLPEAGPAVYRAPRTGLPASVFRRLAEGETELQDRGLERRSTFGHDDADPVGARLDPNETWAFELSTHLGEGYSAVVHIDGNDLGKRIRVLSEAGGDLGDRLSRFSGALSDVTLEAARAGYQATLETLSKQQEERPAIYPGRLAVLGGDDITLILRADLALPFVEAYLARFEELSQERAEALGGPLTACAGVATAHLTYPFDRSHALAEALCGFAKAQLRDRGPGGATPSGVAFHRVTTSAVDDYEGILATELSSGREAGDLTAGPYTLSAVDGFATLGDLQGLAKALDALPLGAVREILALMSRDRKLAVERWGRLGEVVKDDERKATWEEVTRRLVAMGCGETLGRKVGNRRDATPLLDAWTLSRMEDKR